MKSHIQELAKDTPETCMTEMHSSEGHLNLFTDAQPSLFSLRWWIYMHVHRASVKNHCTPECAHGGAAVSDLISTSLSCTIDNLGVVRQMPKS